MGLRAVRRWHACMLAHSRSQQQCVEPPGAAGGFFRKGVSGGERKRTSIAVELLIDPSVLLLVRGGYQRPHKAEGYWMAWPPGAGCYLPPEIHQVHSWQAAQALCCGAPPGPPTGRAHQRPGLHNIHARDAGPQAPGG